MAYEASWYLHDSDRAALEGLKAIPGFHQFVKKFIKIWSERQFRITNMSSCVRINENQLPQYYEMLPPICEKLGIDIPELYLQLNVVANSYTSGDTKPFIVITSGLFETLPEELIPTVLAHECGHIACRHMLYTTMGSILLNRTSSALRSLVPYGGLATMPLEIAFFYWMRCSELSADRAAVLCDGGAEKMSEVCMRLAGYDKDIGAIASKEEFMVQAQEYREMTQNSKWDKTLEFLALSNLSHPLMTVRALECEEWAKSEQFQKILDGTYCSETQVEPVGDIEELSDEIKDELQTEKKTKARFELPKLKRKGKEDELLDEKAEDHFSVPDEIRKYKELLDDGIITEDEFSAKKKQLMNI